MNGKRHVPFEKMNARLYLLTTLASTPVLGLLATGLLATGLFATGLVTIWDPAPCLQVFSPVLQSSIIFPGQQEGTLLQRDWTGWVPLQRPAVSGRH